MLNERELFGEGSYLDFLLRTDLILLMALETRDTTEDLEDLEALDTEDATDGDRSSFAGVAGANFGVGAATVGSETLFV